ncbi:DUF6531 domain-containing protein [Paenibacillus sp. KQZ6P-2]|uniref:DUF6531 domain-containing protein n=1 Tax=Paenibacillus mangrovi TaxID=2931978 RepID=A0A9X2B509_9BACL|nr:DUF6531 domain-containing protein [Paenibacillus mangrovi]MCJ8014565.1 DUF6531 domain-containing protein [Paenibacillus mangrovi]
MIKTLKSRGLKARLHRLGTVGKTLLAFIILIAGIPLVPSQHLPRAFAETSLHLDPDSFSSVYGGQTEVNFRFDNPDPNDDTQQSHETIISLEQNGSTVAVLHEETYPTLVNNKYIWDGKVNGKPVAEGNYQIKVTPKRFPNNGKDGKVKIINPNPPAPKGMEIVPDPASEEHVIRGIAEIGTKVELKMKRIRRVDNNTTVDDGTVETLAANIPVRPITSDWAKKIAVDNTYFTDFPERDDNKPGKYVGEWQIKVKLPVYEIAEIQAFATRDLDKKRSNASETLSVLRYKSPSWGVNWAVVASYYYNVIMKDAIVQKIADIADFNGFPVEDCNGQVCYGPMDKDINLLILNPRQAGEIGRDDDSRIREKFGRRNGYPFAAAFDPINLSTGDFIFNQTNIDVQALLPLDMTLTYHSRDRYDGDFGVGWHHTYERKLEFHEGGVLYAVSPEGASFRFEPEGGGRYKGMEGQYDTLVKNADGTFTQQTPQKWTYTYRKDGKLFRITDANGNTIQLSYTGSLLTEVSTDGAKLSLTYGDGGKVVRVTDQTGRYAAYEYDAVNHDLTAMILPDGARITYTYDEKHRMTEINNPNKTMSLINEYDDQDRVVRQRDFSGAWGDIEYFPDEKKTITTDALGRKTVHFYDDRYRKTATTYPDGTTERFLYDANDNMIQKTDRNGNVWEYMYDGSGNLIRAKDPEGYQTEIRYNAFNLPEEVVDPLGNKTMLGYDGKGNLTTITDPLGGVSKIVVNDRGIAEAVVNPSGETTTIENDPNGFARYMKDPLGNRVEMVRDPLHRVTDIIDALGQRTSLEYDPRDRVTKRIDALGQVERYEYDKDSNLTGYTDSAGSKTTYAYDSYARLSKETDALGGVTRYEYDAIGNLIKVTDPKGAETAYAYDDNNRIASATDPEGNDSKYEYDGNGNLIRQSEASGAETRIEYDRRNLPVQIMDAEGGVTRFSYDGAGRLTQETDPLGHAVVYTYDPLGQLTAQTDALGQVTAYSYDGAGRLIRMTAPNGAEWKMEYDARGLLVKTIDPLGSVSTIARDALGRVVQSTDEAGKTTTYAYDPLNRVTKMVDPLGQATQFAYNAHDLLTGLTDAKGQSTTYAYDPLGRLTQVTNSLGNKTAYAYDSLGNIISKTDALGRVTGYQYNRRSDLIREIAPDQRITELAYDSVGNVTGMTSPDGTVTSYAYDLLSRLTGIQYPDSKHVGYQYDAAGRRTQMTDDLGMTTYTYDALNRLISVRDPNKRTIRYEWTPTGQRSRVEYPDGTSVSYQYDLLDRMTSVTDAAGRTTSYEYDARGLLVSKHLPTLGESNYRYDDAGQLVDLTHRNQFGKILEKMSYAYDPAGNLIRTERMSDGNDEDDDDTNDKEKRIITDYAYDALNQLVQVQRQNEEAGLPSITSYQYDVVGNRTTKSSSWGDLADTENYTYDAAGRLLQMTSGTEINNYRYDPRGNLLEVIQERLQLPDTLKTVAGATYADPTVTANVYDQPADDPAAGLPIHGLDAPLGLMDSVGKWSAPEMIQQYAWDGANRLIRQTNERGDVTQYAYDGDGNRMKMTIDYAHGGKGHGNGNGNGNGNNGNNGNGNNGNGNNGNGNNGNGNNGNGNGKDKCHVVPPGFIPPGLAKKCGQYDEEYPDMHPGGPRDGWEKQYKKEHWELNFTNDVSLALPEPLQVAETDDSKWKQSYVYGAGGERLSMTYLPAYDDNNGWEPSPGEGGAEPGTQPKTLWYMQDALGSVMGLVEKDGRVSARYHYDEFGIPLDDKKFDLNWPGPDNLFGYTGLGYGYNDGLTYARARYYQPEIGRFVSEDTYKGQLSNTLSQNLYVYVENNPLRWIDPSGHYKDSFGAALPVPTDPVKAAEKIKEAQGNWWYAQQMIDRIESGKSTGTIYNKVEYWTAYQESMHGWANRIRSVNHVGISAYIKAEAGASIYAGAKIGVEVKNNKIKLYFIPSYGQAGASATVTGGISLNNDLEGKMSSWTMNEGGAFGALFVGEATLQHDTKYAELHLGGGIGAAAEIYFLPLSVDKEYAASWDLPFNLGGKAGILPTYKGAPNAQEWLNMLNGEGW